MRRTLKWLAPNAVNGVAMFRKGSQEEEESYADVRDCGAAG